MSSRPELIGSGETHRKRKLKKLLKWQQRKMQTAVMTMKTLKNRLCFWFFELWHSIHSHRAHQYKILFG